MKQKLIEVALSAPLTFGVASVAHAGPEYANSYIYFDENGQVVGQQILLCGDWGSQHAGNIHTAYYIEEESACQDQVPGGNPFPEPTYIAPPTDVVDYVLPSFETIQQACQLIGGCPEEDLPPKRLLNQGWTWYTGWE